MVTSLIGQYCVLLKNILTATTYCEFYNKNTLYSEHENKTEDPRNSLGDVFFNALKF